MGHCEKFRAMLNSDQLEFICEAHNGLSAKIVQEAGFAGIWASGLSISAQLGVRDNNEASWTQVLDVLEFMADAAAIPIMLDGDTGYGNFNNVQRLIRKLEQRGIAAVCLEDKLFPKTNSFISGKRQPLADTAEFAGKIKAGKDAQRNSNFSIVARIEAFIAGWGLDEALARAEAYHAAGADALLIHSALSRPDEVLSFKQAWGDRCPVVIVPTKYYATPTEVFREHGFSMVIWANHMLRSAVTAMQSSARKIFEDQCLLRVEEEIAPVREIFRLQSADELEEAEKRYLPSQKEMPAALVLAASRGKEMGELTVDRPKAMVQIGDKPLLGHIAAGFHSVGIKDITVVRGYKKEAINLPGLSYADNDEYDSTGELHSLQVGLHALEKNQNPSVVCYGDVIFRKYILEALLETEADLVIVADTQWAESANRERAADYVRCSSPYSRKHYGREVWLEAIGENLSETAIHGEWIGFLKISPRLLPVVSATVDRVLASHPQGKMPELLEQLLRDGHPIRVLYTTGNWLDIDTYTDVVNAGNLA